MSKITLAISAVTVAMLTACGGGESDEVSTATPTPTAPAANTSAEGFWSGTTSTGFGVDLAVLENGETWGVYYNSRTGELVGAFNGIATSANGSISGSGIDFSSAGVIAGSFSGNYVSKTSLNLKTSTGATASATYRTEYDQAASVASIVGTYNGYVSTKSATGRDSATVSSNGTIRSGSESTCLTTGTVTPRASGKNVFDVTLNFSGPNCLLGNGTSTRGVSYYDASTRSLLALTLNNGKTDGLMFLGAKQ